MKIVAKIRFTFSAFYKVKGCTIGTNINSCDYSQSNGQVNAYMSDYTAGNTYTIQVNILYKNLFFINSKL